MNLTQRLKAALTPSRRQTRRRRSAEAKMKISTAVATILGISTLVLAVQAGAEWQYTDGKGKTHTVVLKMDVPSEFSNTAREVDTWQPRVQPGPSDLPTPTPNAPSATAQERLRALQNYQRALQEQVAQQRAEAQSIRDALDHPSSATIEAGRIGAGMHDARTRMDRDRRIREKASDLVEKNAAQSLSECDDDDCVNSNRDGYQGKIQRLDNGNPNTNGANRR